MRRSISAVLALALGCALVSVASTTATATASGGPAPGTTTVRTYGSGLGTYSYRVYTPRGWTPRAHLPVYVMVHGCQTTAAQQERANLLDPLANKKHFVVVYPDVNPIEAAQPGPTKNCWQFPSPLDWLRGAGDTAAVAGITRRVVADWRADAHRVYVMGMSAGAFLSADLAATYPDLYAASGENAGGAYADGTCLVQSVVALPAPLSATLARSAMGRRARVVPRIVIGGDADQGIPPACADKALEQSLRTNNLVLSGKQTAPISLTPASVAAGQVPHGRRYTVADYRYRGCLIGQRILVHGMNHFWSGGSDDPALAGFTDPTGPSAAKASWNFFSRFTLGNTAHSC